MVMFNCILKSPYKTLNDVNMINVHVIKQGGSGTSLLKD